MAVGGAGKEKKIENHCCISHAFFKEAYKNPSRIAVVHASGGARIFKELHARADEDPRFAVEEQLNSCRESTFPPLYHGDDLFTYADISSAVDSLSFRISHVLDGGDDPDLIRLDGSNTENSESSVMANTDLAAAGEDAQKIVGIFLTPSVEYIVSVLALLRCGVAFLPLDPFLPKARIISIINSSRVSLIITCTSFGYGCQFKINDWLINQRYLSVLSISMRGILREHFHIPDLVWPCEGRKKQSFCYLMHTSGSTGRPKGVYGTEEGLLNRFLWMQSLFPLHGQDILLFKTPTSFIDHLQEFLAAVLTSTLLIIPPFNEVKENPFCMVDFLKAYQVSRVTTVPSLMRLILPAMRSPHGKMIQESLQILVLSGEILPVSLWGELHKILPGTSILNLYGSTEVSGDCTYFDCKHLPVILETEVLHSVPIGIPISNCNIVLVGNPDSPNEGELYVGGSCLSAGDLFDPMSPEYVELFPGCEDSHDLTRGKKSEVYFRTGDYARQLQCGNFVFMGRKDRSIKVNGQRIALEEIENVLREHPDVDAAAVIFCKGQEELVHLAAYLVLKTKDKKPIDVDGNDVSERFTLSIRRWLVKNLPESVIPSQYFYLESLPLSSSGKIDYLKLRRQTVSPKWIRDKIEISQCNNEILQLIKKVFQEALMAEEVMDDDDFFSMGGNSILAALVAYKLGIDMRILYMHRTPCLLLKVLLNSERFLEKMPDADPIVSLTLKAPTSMLHSFDVMNYVLHRKRSPRTVEVSVGEAHNSTKRQHKEQLKSYTDDNDQFSSSWESLNENSNLYTGWISNVCLSIAVAFCRCNQINYELELEKNNGWQSSLSVKVPRSEKGFLQKFWKVSLDLCVDASPLIVLKDDSISLFIGSHSCIFLCINVPSGLVRWEVLLEGRIECSAAITDDFCQVVVGCYMGKIYFLNFKTGDISWIFQTEGEVKTQPVVDKSNHLIWCGSHDQNLYALDYKSHCCIYRVSCGGSIYGSPSIDKARDRLYVASTCGRVTAISIQALPFNIVWIYEFGAPIFGSLCVNSHNGDVICCLVDGHVMALDSSGSIAWKALTGGPLFAGACISPVLASQVLVCSRNGSVYSFELEGGRLLWEFDTGDPITASAYVDENIQLISDPTNLSSLDRLACICSSSGKVHVLRIETNATRMSNARAEAAGRPFVQKFAGLELPGEIFSSPVMVGGRIFVGCRDDHVYCLDVFCKTFEC